MAKKIFILMGNPDPETLCCDFADVYGEAAQKAGHEVRRTNLIDMKFDPLLHKGYKVIQELEPDLKKFQEDMKWADHFVIVYPIWWSSMPSLLKALFERMWLPMFAFHFWKNGLGWDRLMKGKTARIITLSRSNPMIMHALFGDFTHELKSALLEFSGFRTSQLSIGHSESLTDKQKEKWKKRVAALGRKAR